MPSCFFAPIMPSTNTHESLSLRSFRVNAPPSLSASSLKLPHPLPFHHSPQEPTIRDLILDEDSLNFDMGLPHISATVSMTTSTVEQATLHHSWAKPRTIIRRLTTKFTPRIQTSSPTVPRTPAGPNAFTKECREAALRERGLLPPKDLSAQEKEQDKAIPIILPNDDQSSSSELDSPSAADLIKREWEAKNRSAMESNQLLRMNSFKFGGNFSVPTPVIQFESADSEVLPEVAVPQSTLEIPRISPAVSVSQPDSRPVTPLLDIPPEIAAYLSLSLPPSPRSVSSPKFDLPSCAASPTAVPLPPSPSLRSVFDTTSLRSASGARTPGPLDIRETPLTPTPTPPVIALTPCTAIIPDSDDVPSSPLRKRTDLSVPDESASSSQTPSLDSNSHTTTDSTLSTSESAAITGKGRLGGLKIKTHEGSHLNIPVIVESPIEDSSFLEQPHAAVEPTPICNNNQAALAPMSAPVDGSQPTFTLSAPPMQKRGVTDPGNLNRKKSMIVNPFKRGLSSGYEDQSGEPPKRLTVKTSFTNMRRSVVGTLSRMTSPDRVSGGNIFDASHLPPSPIFLGKLDSPTSPSSGTEERKAVSPIVYSRGHILMEASHIKDAESRRVTEMAFLT